MCLRGAREPVRQYTSVMQSSGDGLLGLSWWRDRVLAYCIVVFLFVIAVYWSLLYNLHGLFVMCVYAPVALNVRLG